MKQYIGTKMIQAVKGLRVKYVGKEYFLADGAEVSQEAQEALENSADIRDMYMVQYPDGYVSFSPVDVFEEAYRPTEAMNFGLAIEAAKKGARIARAGWNGKGQYVELASCISYTNASGEVINAVHDAIGNRALAFCGTSGVQLGWLASQADMLADDWHIVEQAVERCD